MISYKNNKSCCCNVSRCCVNNAMISYYIILWLYMILICHPIIYSESFQIIVQYDYYRIDYRQCFISTKSRQQRIQRQQPSSNHGRTTRITTSTTSSNSRTFLQSNCHQQLKINYQRLRRNGEWIPRKVSDDDIFGSMNEEDLEGNAVELATNLIKQRLQDIKQSNNSHNLSNNNDLDVTYKDNDNSETVELVKGRFIDLACDKNGEQVLEMLFLSNHAKSIIQNNYSKDDIRGAIIVIQSLCIMGTQIGMKGPPEQLKRQVSHLNDDNDSSIDPLYIHRDMYECWDHDSVRRLKFRRDREPGLELLASLKRRRINQGAFDLLIDIGVWTEHEDLALLRSGFPLRFTNHEENDAIHAFHYIHDPDTILGIRQDLRHLKVYTIDGASASEIDDGVSIERISKVDNNNNDGQQKYRMWIHIADADRWAPRNSSLIEIARRRITSLYLPSGAIPMFPSSVSVDLMSLKANRDVCALSLGVELNEDGSIDTSTIILTPSIINVNYRLTYDDVDEMLEEGSAYREEWQLGALFDAAKKRREYRIANGSVEGAVPNPIPYGSVDLSYGDKANDKIRLKLSIQVSHNGAQNKTNVEGVNAAGSSLQQSIIPMMEDPVSSAYLLVTEAMILAGEAIGTWKCKLDDEDSKCNNNSIPFKNQVRLPFRTQAVPDFKGRSREYNVLQSLLEHDIGNGLCHAWYMRRFLQSVRIQEQQAPHSGLGLQSYVQWSSPIRRFSDLQVHASVKRYLRRQRLYELFNQNEVIPNRLRPIDFGISNDAFVETNDDESLTLIRNSITIDDLDQDLNFLEGLGLVTAGKNLQRQSQKYWLFEYIRRTNEVDPTFVYKACILGCIDSERQQYAIYVYDLGLEHRYISPINSLEPGTILRLKVDSVNPRAGLLNFVRVV